MWRECILSFWHFIKERNEQYLEILTENKHYISEVALQNERLDQVLNYMY